MGECYKKKWGNARREEKIIIMIERIVMMNCICWKSEKCKNLKVWWSDGTNEDRECKTSERDTKEEGEEEKKSVKIK